MKRRILMLLFAACALAAQPAFAGSQVSQKDAIASVLRLVDAGLSDGVIVRHIPTRGFVFDLSDDDLVDLRKRGVSDTVLEAMLDTGLTESEAPGESVLQAEPAPEPEPQAVREEPESHVSVVMSAGWFSPWYYYPSAWGFYYDPFPMWYSYYYYPFNFCSSWGYYGYCSNYYYPNYWRPYRWWNDPSCYQTAMSHPGVRVTGPRTDVITWRTGRGVPSARPHYISTAGSPSASRGRNALDAPIVRRSVSRDAVHARQSEYSGSTAGSPRSSRHQAVPAQSPRSSPSRSAAPAPRQHVPSSHFAPPASAPHSGSRSSAPRGGSMTSAPRGGGASVAPRGGGASMAPRSGGVSMAPRSGVGARLR